MRFYFAASLRDEISIRQCNKLKVASTANLYGWNRTVSRAPSLWVWRLFWHLTNFRFLIKTHDYQKRQWQNFPVIIFFNPLWTNTASSLPLTIRNAISPLPHHFETKSRSDNGSHEEYPQPQISTDEVEPSVPLLRSVRDDFLDVSGIFDFR